VHVNSTIEAVHPETNVEAEPSEAQRQMEELKRYETQPSWVIESQEKKEKQEPWI
jgi:hypothetical protein